MQPKEKGSSNIPVPHLPDDHLFPAGSPPDILGMHIREIRSKIWLTIEEETILFTQIAYGRRMAKEFARGGGQWTEAQKQEHHSAIQTGQRALDHILLIHAKQVVGIAKKIPGNVLPLLDLIQEGNIGLIRATQKFDPSRGKKFRRFSRAYLTGN